MRSVASAVLGIFVAEVSVWIFSREFPFADVDFRVDVRTVACGCVRVSSQVTEQDLVKLRNDLDRTRKVAPCGRGGNFPIGELTPTSAPGLGRDEMARWRKQTSKQAASRLVCASLFSHNRALTGHWPARQVGSRISVIAPKWDRAGAIA